jgi:F-type H+-transporting ATPase subunit gamma
MATLREIRRRIRSVQGVAKITKAMELVAAAKMRRAQERLLASRPYAEKMREVLADLAARRREDEPLHPLMVARPTVNRIGIVLITADRGLCGAFNANVNRRASQFILEQSVPVSLVVVGRKGRDFMVRAGQPIRAEFTQLGDYPSLVVIRPIARVVIDDYTSGYVDRVVLVYNRFVSTMVQRPVVEQLLPVEPPPADAYPRHPEYIYEPDPETVLREFLPRYVEIEIYQAILESIGGEYSARMVAMRNATDNALEVVNNLILIRNKLRQEIITKELLEIAAGAAALGG